MGAHSACYLKDIEQTVGYKSQARKYAAHPVTAGDARTKDFCLGTCHFPLQLCQLHLHSGKEGCFVKCRPFSALTDLQVCMAQCGSLTMSRFHRHPSPFPLRLLLLQSKTELVCFSKWAVIEHRSLILNPPPLELCLPVCNASPSAFPLHSLPSRITLCLLGAATHAVLESVGPSLRVSCRLSLLLFRGACRASQFQYMKISCPRSVVEGVQQPLRTGARKLRPTALTGLMLVHVVAKLKGEALAFICSSSSALRSLHLCMTSSRSRAFLSAKPCYTF